MTVLAGAGNGASATELIRFFGRARESGTLALRRGAASLYCLFEEGRVRLQRETGPFGPLADPVDEFSFMIHEPNELPWLAPVAAGSRIAALRALPYTGAAGPLAGAATDLPVLLDQLREKGFDGALTLAGGGELGVAVFTDGYVRACAFERDGYVWQRVDALRALHRHSLRTEPEAAPLMLQALDAATALSLAGLALDARAGSDNLAGYDGAASGDNGYVYHLDGKPYLQVRTSALVAGVRYAQPGALPDLRLPGGEPGWEQVRYELTLRGRDALIPMTELAMDFERRHGSEGRRILALLQGGMSVEDVSAEMQLELTTMRESLESLKVEGMIRPRA